MESTSAKASKNNLDKIDFNSVERCQLNNEFIPDISSPSNYTQTSFQVLHDKNIALDLNDSTAIKCILIGDSKVGKSSLVISYTSNGFPDVHKPTAFDVYKVEISVEERLIQLQICDTGGSEEVSSLRFLAYPDCHTFILCFSVIDPSSFYNLINHWFKEIESYSEMNNSAVVLVGCRCDERNNISHLLDLSAQGKGPITEQIVRQHADKLRADAYIECSALTEKNLKRVFDLAIWYSMKVYDRCLAERNKIAIDRNLEKSFKNSRKKSKKQGSYSYDRGGISNSGHNEMPVKCPISEVDDKSLWKKLFCVSL